MRPQADTAPLEHLSRSVERLPGPTIPCCLRRSARAGLRLYSPSTAAHRQSKRCFRWPGRPPIEPEVSLVSLGLRAVREARQIREPATLRVEIGDARRSWPALILAATQNSASVVIDPSVARHPSSLAMVLSGKLPAALPTELFAVADWNAELSAEIAQITDSFEAIPMPDAPKPSRKFAPPISAHLVVS